MTEEILLVFSNWSK